MLAHRLSQGLLNMRRSPSASASRASSAPCARRARDAAWGARMPASSVCAPCPTLPAWTMRRGRPPSSTCRRAGSRSPSCRARGRGRRCGLHASAEAISLIGLEGLRDRNARKLSGGERQRAFLAMTVAQGARTLLLDEPTTYLDARAALDLMQLVRRLADEQGTTIVCVTHDVDLDLRFSDGTACSAVPVRPSFWQRALRKRLQGALSLPHRSASRLCASPMRGTRHTGSFRQTRYKVFWPSGLPVHSFHQHVQGFRQLLCK